MKNCHPSCLYHLDYLMFLSINFSTHKLVLNEPSATTSFHHAPITSHFSLPTVTNRFPRTRTILPAQRRSLISVLCPQTTVHRHSQWEPHATSDSTAWRRAPDVAMEQFANTIRTVSPVCTFGGITHNLSGSSSTGSCNHSWTVCFEVAMISYGLRCFSGFLFLSFQTK